MSSLRVAPVVAIALASCAADPPGVVVVVDAQPWGRANAAALEVVVLDAEGVQRGRELFALVGDDAVSLPVRVWVRARDEATEPRFVIAATLLDEEGAPLMGTVATGEIDPSLRTGLLCIEDGCRFVSCSAADACASDPESCERCAGRACVPAELVYTEPFACQLAEATETACFDGRDSDADDLLDCSDDDCDGEPCDSFGRTCIAEACQCASGMETEARCDDGMNDDCDADGIDCDDTDCEGMACGANGLACEGGACVCPFGEIVETSCHDGSDNDCDGSADCEDPDCQSPGPEIDCGNGVDDDCNGGADCADAACDRQTCATRSVCCGTTCTDIGRTSHCGACTIQCRINPATGDRFFCDSNDRIDAIGWGCGCRDDGDCPAGQYCMEELRRCSCANGGVGCEAGQECSRRMGDWNFCFYD